MGIRGWVEGYKRRVGHSCRKRIATSKVAPPHISIEKQPWPGVGLGVRVRVRARVRVRVRG